MKLSEMTPEQLWTWCRNDPSGRWPETLHNMVRIVVTQTLEAQSAPVVAPEEVTLQNSAGTYRAANRHKLRYDLVPLGPLSELAKVYTSGANRYGDRNWEQGMSFSRCYAAAQRHLLAFWNGSEIDIDTGEDKVKHLAAAAWNIFALLHYSQVQTLRDQFDDRPYQIEMAEMKK